MGYHCVRLTDEQSEFLEQAAAVEGLEPVDFVRKAVADAAMATLDKYYVTRLSLEQGKKMMEALDRSDKWNK